MYNDIAKNKPNHSAEYSFFIVQPHLFNSRKIDRYRLHWLLKKEKFLKFWKKQFVKNGNFTNVWFMGTLNSNSPIEHSIKWGCYNILLKSRHF